MFVSYMTARPVFQQRIQPNFAAKPEENGKEAQGAEQDDPDETVGEMAERTGNHAWQTAILLGGGPKRQPTFGSDIQFGQKSDREILTSLRRQLAEEGDRSGILRDAIRTLEDEVANEKDPK